jgi:hypothetical protein
VTLNVKASLEVDGVMVVADVPQGTNVEVPVVLSGAPGDRTFQLKDAAGNVLGGSATVALGCGAQSGWDTALKLPGKEAGQCSAKLCYGEKVFATRGGSGTLHSVKTGEGAVPVTNMTDIPDDYVASGYLRKVNNFAVGPVDDFGRMTLAGLEQNGDPSLATSYNWMPFYWNPVSQTYHRYGNTPIPDIEAAGFSIIGTFGPLPPAGTVLPSEVYHQVWSEAEGGTYIVFGGLTKSQFPIWFFKDGVLSLVADGSLSTTGNNKVLGLIERTCTP